MTNFLKITLISFFFTIFLSLTSSRVSAQACNTSCAYGCNAGLVCSGGVCRNPSCPGNNTCICALPTNTPTATPRPTGVPPTGVPPTSTPRPTATSTPRPTATPTNTPTPTPTPIPDSHIRGTFQEQGGASNCQPFTSNSPRATVNLSISGQGNATCTVTASDYDCTINYTGVQTSVTANLNALFTGFIGAWKRNPPGVCSDPPSTSETIQAGQTFNWPIYFAITPWMKMQDGSLQTPGISFTIPPIPQAFQVPAGYPNDNADQVLIDDQNGGTTGAGIAATNGSGFPQGIGPPPPLHLSQNNWQPGSNGAYNWPMSMDESAFFTYVKSRKQYQSFNGDLSTLTNGIFYTTSNTLRNQPPANVSAVVLVAGSTTIQNDITRSSLAILSGGQITIANSVSQINSILVAQSVNIGTSSNPLYINGNLVADTALDMSTRTVSNNLRPTIFVQMNPQTYLNLLPLLSIDTYDWTQLQ